MIATANAPTDSSVVAKHLVSYFGVFQHHWDTYLKAHALLYSVIGAIAGYVFKPDIPAAQRTVLICLVIAAAATAVLGGLSCFRWVVEFEAEMHKLEAILGGARFPFSGTRRVITLFSAASGVFLIVGIAALFWF